MQAPPPQLPPFAEFWGKSATPIAEHKRRADRSCEVRSTNMLHEATLHSVMSLPQGWDDSHSLVAKEKGEHCP